MSVIKKLELPDLNENSFNKEISRIEELDISNRVCNVLRGFDIYYVHQLLTWHRGALLKIQGMGRNGLNQVIESLAKYNLELSAEHAATCERDLINDVEAEVDQAIPNNLTKQYGDASSAQRVMIDSILATPPSEMTDHQRHQLVMMCAAYALVEVTGLKLVEKENSSALIERVPYAWEVSQGHRTFLVPAKEFITSSYDTGSFKPLFE